MKTFGSILILIIMTGQLQGQDKIYYKKNKVDNWRVTELNPEYIKAVDVNDPEISYSTSPGNVLFIFNRLGGFITIPDLYNDAANSEATIRNFLQQQKNPFFEFDKLITFRNEIIICRFESVDKTDIHYTIEGERHSIGKSKVAILIKSNGEQQLFSTVEKVFKTLKIVQPKYSELAMQNQSDQVNEDITSDSVMEPTGLAISSVDTQAAILPTQKIETAVNTAPATELEPGVILKLQNKALVNIRQLGDYIRLISQKDADQDDVTRTIEQALTLFIDEARIEVSSTNRSTVNQYKIKDYLIRLGYLKYEKVIIEWYNIQYTSVLRKGPDGFYYGTIEFEQRFVGIASDNRKYEDITRKSVEVVLRSYERNSGGETTLEWDVFLGDIGVTVTKPA